MVRTQPAHGNGGMRLEVTFEPSFDVLTPVEQTLPFIFNTPHSGCVYPAAFLEQSKLDPLTLRRSEDCYVDRLFAGAPLLGAPLLRAHFPRAFLDVNREPYELDPPHVRRSVAIICKHALHARRRRTRKHSQDRWRRPGHLQGKAPRFRGHAPDRYHLPALSSGAACIVAPDAPELWRSHAV